MRRVSPELLVFLLLFVAVPFLNLLAQWLRRRAERERADRRAPADEPAVPEPERPSWRPPRPAPLSGVYPGAAPTAAGVGRARPPATAPLSLAPRRRRPPLGGAAGLRRAMVLVAILGPCRALQGPDPLDTR